MEWPAFSRPALRACARNAFSRDGARWRGRVCGAFAPPALRADGLRFAPEPEKKEVGEKMERALDDLFRYVIDAGGAITGEHGIGLAKKRWWPQAVSPESITLHQTIKQALDPKGILNPGKFL